MFGRRRLAEGVQAQRGGAAGQFVEVIVQRGEKGREILAHARLVPAEVGLQAGFQHRGADLLGAALAHRALVQLLVFVDQVVQVAQLVVQPGRGERRRLVADGDRPPATPGLDGLADVVLDIGVEHRQVAEHPEGIVADGQPAVLAGQPFLGAVGAEVDQRVGVETLAQVLVDRQVEVVRWHLASW